MAAQTFDETTREAVALRLRLHVYPHLMPSSEAKVRAAVDRALGVVDGPRALDVP